MARRYTVSRGVLIDTYSDWFVGSLSLTLFFVWLAVSLSIFDISHDEDSVYHEKSSDEDHEAQHLGRYDDGLC